jgi:diguanylate cyclase (GGDEF)-like protein/PAS domain S-box-containing protein
VFFINTTQYPDADFVLTPWGWMYPYSNDMTWHSAFLVYYSLFAAWSLWLIYRWGRRSKTTRIRKQSEIMVKSTLIVYALGAPTDTLLPMLGIQLVPVGVIFSTIFTAGIWYSITRYRLMTLSFKSAADHILSTMMDPLLLVGEDLRIREVNRKALMLTGRTENELIGASLGEVLQDLKTSPIDSAAFFTKDHSLTTEVLVEKINAAPVSCLMSTRVMYDEFQDLVGIILFFQDITDRKKYESLLKQTNEELEVKVRDRTQELEDSNITLQKEIIERKAAQDQIWYNANHDALTGLPNRRLFYERLKSGLDRTQGTENVLAVLFIDLDNFKYINDTFGHKHGDLILQQVASRMERSLRHGDTLSRVGGDEFLLIIGQLQAVHIRRTLEKVIRSIREALLEPFVVDGGERFLTVSIGVAAFPEDGTDADTLIKNADIAMYDAKYSGKNAYRFCSSPMKQKVLEKAVIRQNLFRALHDNEFSLFFQPQVQLYTGTIVGLEALIRWRPHGGSFISPDQFIPIAEETGLIVPIGEWVIRTAFRQLKDWNDMGFQNLRVAINVSARQLRERNFMEKTRQCMLEAGVTPGEIEFEITESIAFKRDAQVLDMLTEIKESGIGIAIDDFGTEYSSFMNVKMMPVDRLKIAMPFVSGIGKNEKDAAIVSSIIALSHKIGLKVIAEGVETEIEADYLSRENCDEIQGYYYYFPVPAEKIPDLLRNTRSGVAS